MTDNITQLRGDRPLLNDIPGWLRKFATDIENGALTPPYVMVIVPPAAETAKWDWPVVMLVGKEPGDLERTGLIAQAQAFMTIHKVARAG